MRQWQGLSCSGISWLNIRSIPFSQHRRQLAIFVLLAAVSCCTAMRAQAVNQINAPVDTTRVLALANHLPHWANATNSVRAVAGDQTLDHLTIVLARSAQQQQSFEKFLAAQQDPASSEYHHWLTPAEVGQRFGFSDSDITAITNWLESEGLHVNWISPSRIFVGFGGTTADISRALQTEFYYYNVNGEERMSVASDPMVPAALLPAIKTIHGLYTIEEHPAHQMDVEQLDSPELTVSGSHFITPGDFARIYDFVTLNSGGTGETIGIVGRARTNSADFYNFKSLTETNFQNPTEVVPTGFGGVDPGPALTAPPGTGVSIGDQGEATLDVLRAGSTAQEASLLLVVATDASGGIEADAQYLVQTSPVPAQVMTISFGACESAAGASGVSFWDTLFQQAAAEGISSFVSSGDSGASGCDDAFSTLPASPVANSPNYICSSSYATCVGGTEFADGSSNTYWGGSNGYDLSSALGYIPEGAWNEPLNSKSTTQAASSGGGVSGIIPTPAWQTGTGVPVARAGRYTPDISFSASGHDGYFACFAAGGGSCVLTNGGYPFEIFAGTSAAAPAMAGVAALLDQRVGSAQGNLNPNLYKMATNLPAAFHDVTVASSSVTGCSVNTPSMCNNSIPGPNGLTGGQAGYLVGTGYDEVTGLGSLDVGTFLYNYLIQPTVTVTPLLNVITVVQSLSVSVTVSGGSGNPVPTGSVKLTSGSYTSPVVTLTAGSATIDIPAGSLTAGDDTLTVNYTPDSASSTTFGIGSGANSVTVNLLTPTVTVTPSSAAITTAQELTVTVVVSGGPGSPAPTGTVCLNGSNYSGPVALSGGTATIHILAGMLSPGSNALGVNYTPDMQGALTYSEAGGASYVTVTAIAPYTPAVTVTAPSSILQLQSFSVSVAVSGRGTNPTPTGSIILFSAGYISSPINLSGGGATITIPAASLSAGQVPLYAVYAPDANSASTYNNTFGVSLINVTPPIAPGVQVLLGWGSSTFTTGDTLSVEAVVRSSGGVNSPTGTVVVTGGSFTSSATALSTSGTTGWITIPPGSLPVGMDTITATYTPDAAGSIYFADAVGTSTIAVSVPPPPSFAVSGTNVTVTAGTASGNTSTVTIKSIGGFVGSVTLTAAITLSPSGAQDLPTVSFGSAGPVTLVSAAGGSATLTINTTAATSAAMSYPARSGMRWISAGGAALAGLLLLWIPRRRRWRTFLGLVALLVALTGGVVSCGSGNGSVSGGGGSSSNSGTTLGTYIITVTGTSGSLTSSGTIVLIVE
jgi:subtilase family serine protease